MMRLDVSHVVNYYHCDLRCPYCVTDWNNQRDTRQSPPRDVLREQEQRLLRAIATLPFQVHLTLSNAGEPFVNRWLLDLIADLCGPQQRGAGLQALTLVTNLHADWDDVIGPFLDRVDPQRLVLACSLHDTVVSAEDAEAFFVSCERARDRGVAVMVISVVLPGQLDRAFACKRRCEALDLPYLPNPLVAAEGGRGFGLSASPYSREEIALARQLTETPHAHKILFERRTTRGAACHAGQRYVYVDSAGEAFPCVSLKDSPDRLGNVLDGSFRLRDLPFSCPLSSCGCATDASAIALVDDRYARTADHRHLRRRHAVDEAELDTGYGPSLFDVASAVRQLSRQSADRGVVE